MRSSTAAVAFITESGMAPGAAVETAAVVAYVSALLATDPDAGPVPDDFASMLSAVSDSVHRYSRSAMQ